MPSLVAPHIYSTQYLLIFVQLAGVFIVCRVTCFIPPNKGERETDWAIFDTIEATSNLFSFTHIKSPAVHILATANTHALMNFQTPSEQTKELISSLYIYYRFSIRHQRGGGAEKWQFPFYCFPLYFLVENNCQRIENNNYLLYQSICFPIDSPSVTIYPKSSLPSLYNVQFSSLCRLISRERE